MTRMSDIQERQREKLEGAQAMMGRARRLLEMVEMRVGRAAAEQPGLLHPALSDLGETRAALWRAQDLIGQAARDLFGQ